MTITTEEPAVHAHQAQPLQERISQRAHEMFLARGGEQGRDLEDWLQAEAELTGLEVAGGGDR